MDFYFYYSKLEYIDKEIEITSSMELVITG